MNTISIKPADGGYIVNYYAKNPNYKEPKEGEKNLVYTPKMLYKTKVFTDATTMHTFVVEQLKANAEFENSPEFSDMF